MSEQQASRVGIAKLIGGPADETDVPVKGEWRDWPGNFCHQAAAGAEWLHYRRLGAVNYFYAGPCAAIDHTGQWPPYALSCVSGL